MKQRGRRFTYLPRPPPAPPAPILAPAPSSLGTAPRLNILGIQLRLWLLYYQWIVCVVCVVRPVTPVTGQFAVLQSLFSRRSWGLLHRCLPALPTSFFEGLVPGARLGFLLVDMGTWIRRHKTKYVFNVSRLQSLCLSKTTWFAGFTCLMRRRFICL